MGARILVIDDEPQMTRSIRLILTGHGFEVTAAATGEGGLAEVARHIPDLVLLDLMLPDIPGQEVCRRIRRRTDVPIIVLSARGEEAVKIEALDLGADDYLTKPFGAGELLARIRVALRHAAGAPTGTTLAIGDLSIDVCQRTASLRGEALVLTPLEFDVLKYLVQQRDRVVTHAAILRAVWGPEYVNETQYVRNVVLSLRRKIEPDPSRPRSIVTEPGIGYRMRSESA